ncbi:Hypp8221 [Branchiostoma lanceolatum]|uniref:Hypp8221 protein n=1 Tax=Branchiostoma lanceolatum TaxID=7740 RepID=A0A8J9Z7H4_BRALA|nr:Hypp8221 [Branchiostoma lanceolatum]
MVYPIPSYNSYTPAPSSQKSFGWSTQIRNGNKPGGNGNKPGGNGNPVHYVQPMNVQAITHVNPPPPPAHNPPQQPPANPAPPLQANQPAHPNDELFQRKGMKAVRKLPADFEESRDSFHERIKEAVAQHHILDDTVVNFDQTGVPIVPVGGWTLEEAGANQVPICVLEDKRLGLEKDQPGLAVFDGYKAHRTEPVLAKLREANVIPMLVPASCTGELQPLDSDGGLNDALKKDLTKSFMTYYADSIAKEIVEDCLDNAKVDLRLSKMKALHARWLLSAMDRLSPERELIMRGWERTGIKATMEKKKWLGTRQKKKNVEAPQSNVNQGDNNNVNRRENRTSSQDHRACNINSRFIGADMGSIIRAECRRNDKDGNDQILKHLVNTIDVIHRHQPQAGVLLCGDVNRLPLRRIHAAHPTLRQIVKQPTRGTAVLDVVITNVARLYRDPQVIAPIGRSDHDCVVLQARSPDEKHTPVKLSRRVVSHSNKKSFALDIATTDWSRVLQATSVEEKVSAFYDATMSLVEHHFPVES